MAYTSYISYHHGFLGFSVVVGSENPFFYGDALAHVIVVLKCRKPPRQRGVKVIPFNSMHCIALQWSWTGKERTIGKECDSRS